MFYTCKNPDTGLPVPVARGLRDRRLQRALLQFFKPENWFEVREALLSAGRKDLIGAGCDALIPSNPPREALMARRAKANKDIEDHVHSKEIPKVPKKGYRPGRANWGRREGKRP
jgi:hypothetical protein